jgi:hypothetical protein
MRRCNWQRRFLRTHWAPLQTSSILDGRSTPIDRPSLGARVKWLTPPVCQKSPFGTFAAGKRPAEAMSPFRFFAFQPCHRSEPLWRKSLTAVERAGILDDRQTQRILCTA